MSNPDPKFSTQCAIPAVWREVRMIGGVRGESRFESSVLQIGAKRRVKRWLLSKI